MPVERFDPDVHLADAVRLGRMYYEEAGFEHFSVRKFLQIAMNPNLYAAVYRKDGKIIAGMIGFIAPNEFGEHPPMAKDIVLYVEPECRGGLAGVRLVRDFEKWAKEHGVSTVQLAQSTGLDVERTRRWYEALGYEVTGFVTRRRV